MFTSAASLCAKRAVVVTTATIMASAGLAGNASADPGIDTIGPGPSGNSAGVKCVEQALNRAIKDGQLTGLRDVSILEVDGKYGQAVYTDVKRFQEAKALAVDGAVGPDTGDKLLPYVPEGQDCLKNIPTTVSSADSVPSPQPGRTLTPYEMCHMIGPGLVSDGHGGCDSEGVIGGGRPPWDCIQEAFGKDLLKEAVNEYSKKTAEESAKQAGEQIPKSALKGILKKLGAGFQGFKCAWWDLPDK